SENRKKEGRMYAAGWHGSMEAGKSIVTYATKPDKAEEFAKLTGELPRVQSLFRDRFLRLMPGGAKEMIALAEENHIPAFADIAFDGQSSEEPFANSLTITNDDFANYQHKDKDKIAVAFGLWWTSHKRKEGRGTSYEFTPDVDHKDVQGGGFLFGEYGVGVDFERASGLIDLFWRGKHNFHSTLHSESRPNATRWGTSVQMTTAVSNIAPRLWK
ncbi:hypothetical protein PLICRDRAFT_72159, partial [Plicaturopsis crispa FD-325 SS-3]